MKNQNKRHYSDEDKATALTAISADKGNLSKTARELGIPVRTLSHWFHGRGIHKPELEMSDNHKEPLSDKLEALAYRLVDSLDKKLPSASAREIAIAIGIAIDKMQVLRGRPNEITHETSSLESVQSRACYALCSAALRIRSALTSISTAKTNQ
jgi:transposase-like protein